MYDNYNGQFYTWPLVLLVLLCQDILPNDGVAEKTLNGSGCVDIKKILSKISSEI